MANLLITWVLIGAFIGFSANFLEFFTTRQKLITSMFLGIAGAASGGSLGEFVTGFSASSVYISPLIYSIIGAAILSLIPVKNRLL